MIETVIAKRPLAISGLHIGRVMPPGDGTAGAGRMVGGRMVGPFIFFDHVGPMELAAGIPREVDVRPHPHIGLSAVTYLFEGEVMHRDSLGSEQAIRPREVNWMTAGRGITHSERFERARREGGRLHGIQAWVALPEADEEVDPTFEHCDSAGQPVFTLGGAHGILVVGQAFGLRAKATARSPLFYIHWELAAGSRAELPAGYAERAVYVVAGRVEVRGLALEQGQMAILAQGGEAMDIFAPVQATVIAIGGEPVGTRFIEWNFVASSRERIQQAKADWRAGRMKLPDRDHDEFIPLP